MGSFIIGRFNQQHILICNYIICFQVTLVQIINLVAYNNEKDVILS
jgi:hypothetical protein